MRLDPSLSGAELATFWRRLSGIAIDLLIVFLLGVPTLFAITYISTRISAPRIIELVSEMRAAEDSAEREAVYAEFVTETTYLIYKRMPDRLPGELIEAFEAVDSTSVVATDIDTTVGDTSYTYATYMDSAAVDSLIRDYDWNYTVAFSDKPITKFNERDRTVQVGMYLFMGHISMVANFGAVLIVYFTLCLWLLRGFTPGKWMVRIRVYRLDNRMLSLWDSFGRAGGYSASVATLGLGFLEALWHPNKQAVHDRISGTVVIRIRKKKSLDPSTV
jgi:RDD family